MSCLLLFLFRALPLYIYKTMVVQSDLETGPINCLGGHEPRQSLFPSPSEEILSISSSEGLSLPDYTDFLGAWRKKHLLAKGLSEAETLKGSIKMVIYPRRSKRLQRLAAEPNWNTTKSSGRGDAMNKKETGVSVEKHIYNRREKQSLQIHKRTDPATSRPKHVS